jgi:prepilin-type N-terminal cleavage/methylation domain-containing protein
MALYSKRPSAAASIQGFSLVELSIVVAIISVVATLGLEVAANFVNRTTSAVSRERLKVVDEATAAFFKIYGRLPCPANKTLPPENTNYGTEDCTIAVITGTTLGGGVMAGAVPFRTINLPVIYSLDGFASKFNYAVTKNQTEAGLGATQFANSANVAGIEVRTGVLEQPCSTSKCQVLASPASNSGAAYFIFSSGADQRGAVSARGVALKDCANPTATSDPRIDSQNCTYGNATIKGYLLVAGGGSIPNNVFYDNRLNAGLNRSSYYDDVAVWRPRLQL